MHSDKLIRINKFVRTEDYFEHLFHKINGKLSFLVSISYNTLVERHSSSCHVFKAFLAL